MNFNLNRRQFLKITGVLSTLPLFKNPMNVIPIGDKQNEKLDQKIGQMLLIGFRGLEVDENHPIVQDIKQRHIGSVVLFDYDVSSKSPVRNVKSPEQLKKLVDDLQKFSSIPLIVSIDQEGGRVCRLKEKFGFPPTVSHQFLGKKNDLTLTRKEAMVLAQTMYSLGVNMNLAPVVDLNTNPENPVIGKLERSFSADPEIVTKHALEFIRAHHEKGVLCTLKHFPGHGSSTGDSHSGLTDVTKTWSEEELIPYENVIKAGLADAVMTAHVFNSNLDKEYPATLSKAVITGILREKLKFDGVIISDDMQMGAIVNYYGFEKAIQLALEAGIDILAFANNSVYDEDAARKAHDYIKKLVKDGIIKESRIDVSFERIMKLKKKINN